MIILYDEAWTMIIDFNLIIHWIINNDLRKNNYTITKARKVYKLIQQYAKADDLMALEQSLDLLPKVKHKLTNPSSKTRRNKND